MEAQPQQKENIMAQVSMRYMTAYTSITKLLLNPQMKLIFGARNGSTLSIFEKTSLFIQRSLAGIQSHC